LVAGRDISNICLKQVFDFVKWENAGQRRALVLPVTPLAAVSQCET
jgi:hypothetical protein